MLLFIICICIVSTTRVDALALISYWSAHIVNDVIIALKSKYWDCAHCIIPCVETLSGEVIAVVGGCEALGSWCHQKAVVLSAIGDGCNTFSNVLDDHNGGFCALFINTVYLSSIG